MILVKRNAGIIPQDVLDAAISAQAALEQLPESERPAFIKSKGAVWRAFGQYLSQMSYGKCWYSESNDPHSFFDVDHFRPKLEAKRSETEVDKPGYEWLAFSWENFRYAAVKSNRLSTNNETGLVDGKQSWFPLLDNVKACWADRCIDREKPLLLDPLVQSDVDLIDIAAGGKVVPSRFAASPTAKKRVLRSCELYGLNLPNIVAARNRVMREIIDAVEILVTLTENASDPQAPSDLADRQPINKPCDMIREKTRPQSPYSKAARAQVILSGYPELLA